MSYASDAADPPAGRSPLRVVIAVVLIIIGILGIIAGVLYLTEPAHSLPSILGSIQRPHKEWNSHRSLRGSVSLGVGAVVFIVGVISFLWKGRDRY